MKAKVQFFDLELYLADVNMYIIIFQSNPIGLLRLKVFKKHFM